MWGDGGRDRETERQKERGRNITLESQKLLVNRLSPTHWTSAVIVYYITVYKSLDHCIFSVLTILSCLFTFWSQIDLIVEA